MAISRYSCATASTAKRYSSGTSCGPPASSKYSAFLACIASANRGVFRNCAVMALLGPIGQTRKECKPRSLPELCGDGLFVGLIVKQERSAGRGVFRNCAVTALLGPIGQTRRQSRIRKSSKSDSQGLINELTWLSYV